MSQNTQSTLHQQPLQNHPSQHTNSEHPSGIILQAQDYLNALSQAFETEQLPKTRLLERLFQDLSQTLSDYENSLNKRSNKATEKSLSENALNQNLHTEHIDQHTSSQYLIEAQQLEKHHHLLWLCNQARYYLTQPYTPSQQRNDRALWQVKGAVKAIAKFRLLVHLRSLLPGKAPKTIAWRDILPGFKL